jgi:small-conductance mechanosensitive channel
MFENILNKTFWDNTILEYAISIGIFIVSVIAIKIFRTIFLKRLKAWSQKTASTIDDFLIKITKHILVPLAYLGALYGSINSLTLHPLLNKTLNILGVAVLTIAAARFAVLFLGYGFGEYMRKRGKEESLERSLDGILRVAKVIIWGLAIVFFFDNLGFEVSTVIAGLGIGGVAVALAAQAVLKDLFSYFSILFDRPFEIGDFIILDDYLGTIEHVGIKTTRVRSLGGEQLIFSNTDLTSSRLRNYKRMERRRVVFKLGVVYQTSYEKLKNIPDMIKKIIESVEKTEFDRAHFSSYGDFNLVFEVVYYVLSKDYNEYMDIQQEINLAIKKKFKEEEIEFAYPTQTLFVEKQG